MYVYIYVIINLILKCTKYTQLHYEGICELPLK